jgi:hypothetical protein
MGLFDALKDTVLRRGTDDPLFRAGVDKLNEMVGDKRREAAASRWPLASDPHGIDVLRPLLTDAWWALNYGKIETDDFAPKRVDTVDAAGWHFGYGTQFMGLDIDGPDAAGGTTKYENDLWVEVELEPAFDSLSLDARLRLLLDGMEHSYRRVEMPDDVPQSERLVHTGRFRPTGDWCAVAHLRPLVLRARSDRQDYSRQQAESLMHSVLERLDVDAFVRWRDLVHQQNGTVHDPSTPPWAGGRRAAQPAPTAAPVPRSGPVALPTPDDINVGMDRSSGEPLDLDAEAIARSLGDGLQKARQLVLDGFGDGLRIQAPAGRMVDVIRATDPVALDGLKALDIAGVQLDAVAPDGTGLDPTASGAWAADLETDTDGAARRLVRTESGGTWLLRVRGVKRADTAAVLDEVVRRLPA